MGGRPRGRRVGRAAGPRAGGGDGVPRDGPHSARSSGRCGSDSRSRSHFSPSRVMSRRSSQSWWSRAARRGPATQRGRAGGTLRGVGDPGYARPSLERTSGSPLLGHCWGTPRGRKCCLAERSALSWAGGGVGWGVRVAMGTRRPLAGWEELADPPGCAPRLRSDPPRPDRTPDIAPRRAGGPRRRGCLTPTGGSMWVGSAVPPRFRRGREPRAGRFQARGCLLAPGQLKKRGAVGDREEELEREARRRSTRERRARPPTVRNPCSHPLAPWSHSSRPGKGCTSLSAVLGWDAQPEA